MVRGFLPSSFFPRFHIEVYKSKGIHFEPLSLLLIIVTLVPVFLWSVMIPHTPLIEFARKACLMK